MFVGVYRVEIFIPGAHSLKEKRSVLQSLKAKLGQLGLAVAEVDGQDLWQRASLGVAAVSSDSGWLQDLPARIESVVLREPRANLLRVNGDFRPFDP